MKKLATFRFAALAVTSFLTSFSIFIVSFRMRTVWGDFMGIERFETATQLSLDSGWIPFAFLGFAAVLGLILSSATRISENYLEFFFIVILLLLGVTTFLVLFFLMAVNLGIHTLGG